MENGPVLIAIINRKADFAILEESHWYRVPVASRPRRWPPKWVAFYQTKVFDEEAFAVNYHGRVREIRQVRRAELFPNEIASAKAEREYYQVHIESLERLERPVPSKRWRRITFIPTTWQKLHRAEEINDLFDDSPLENALWSDLQRKNIPAERQWPERVDQKQYQLDFAIFCANGKIDIETDGDTWHSQRERIRADNLRDNALTEQGWRVLRFNGSQVREASAKYCIGRITRLINRLGGLNEGIVPRRFYAKGDEINQQLTLFEERGEYDAWPDEFDD